MDYSEILKYQEDLIKKYKYKAIPPLFREETLKFYKENLPEFFSLDGADVPLFSPEGLKLCNRYNRIVVGDYGAYIEILPEDIIHENIKVKDGQEYRDFDERYSKHTKYSWLTSNDTSDIKIYFQKKTVDYADYVPGRYYISPYECSISRILDKGNDIIVPCEKIEIWLNKHGVCSKELIDYYEKLSSMYGNVLVSAIEHNLLPEDFEYWIKLKEVCNLEKDLSFEQFQAVKYNLDLINCTSEELKVPFSALSEDIRIAIQLGIEEFPFPCDTNILSADDIRSILKMNVDALLVVSHFSKVIAGCKADEYTNAVFSVDDVNKIIREAESRTSLYKNKDNDCELVL